MANYFCILPVPDAHIDFIHEHPQTLSDYLNGEAPDFKPAIAPKPSLWQRITGNVPVAPAPPAIPTDWPTSECQLIGEAVNHRNVDLFHLILTGSTEFVSGSGAFFQTWLESGSTRQHNAVDLTHVNEDFAFKSGQVPELAALLSQVNMDDVKLRFSEWLHSQGESNDVTDEDCTEIFEEFKTFAATANSASQQTRGLIWISC